MCSVSPPRPAPLATGGRRLTPKPPHPSCASADKAHHAGRILVSSSPSDSTNRTRVQQDSCFRQYNMGFNAETVEYGGISFTVWDVGGQGSIRRLWKHYFHGTQGLIFFVDSSDRERLPDARDELNMLLNEHDDKTTKSFQMANRKLETTALELYQKPLSKKAIAAIRVVIRLANGSITAAAAALSMDELAAQA